MACLVDWLLVSRWGMVRSGKGWRDRACAYLDEKDVCSSFCECDGHRLTDASRTSSYESRLALERKELLDRRHVVDVVIGVKTSEWLRQQVWRFAT